MSGVRRAQMMARNSLTAYRTARSAFCALEPNLLPSSRKSGYIASICVCRYAHAPFHLGSQHGKDTPAAMVRPYPAWVWRVSMAWLRDGDGAPCLTEWRPEVDGPEHSRRPVQRTWASTTRDQWMEPALGCSEESSSSPTHARPTVPSGTRKDFQRGRSTRRWRYQPATDTFARRAPLRASSSSPTCESSSGVGESHSRAVCLVLGCCYR